MKLVNLDEIKQKNIWKDWHWQQREAIKNVNKVEQYFINISPGFLKQFQDSSLKFKITPYMLSKIPRDIKEDEFYKNPWTAQFFSLGEIYKTGPDAYNGTDNWETKEEFPTKIIHHKYTNRTLIRFRNCFSLCNFCFESLGTLEKEPSKDKIFSFSEWEKTIDYLKKKEGIEEVIFSGGEPLLNSDQKIRGMLEDIEKINEELGYKKIRFKRIHTRALTQNPYRITKELTSIIREYNINEIAFNVAHPEEISDEFIDAVEKIRYETGEKSPILVTHTPLLRNVNADKEILWDLFAKLYENNIKPYYLIHSMPHTPYGDKQRVSVKDGVYLMKQLKRHKTNIALPEFIIAQYDGKVTVPLEMRGTPEFKYKEDKEGNKFVEFLNWKNNWVKYPDCKDYFFTNQK